MLQTETETRIRKKRYEIKTTAVRETITEVETRAKLRKIEEKETEVSTTIEGK
jgi:hypothetical protein